MFDILPQVRDFLDETFADASVLRGRYCATAFPIRLNPPSLPLASTAEIAKW